MLGRARYCLMNALGERKGCCLSFQNLCRWQANTCVGPTSPHLAVNECCGNWNGYALLRVWMAVLQRDELPIRDYTSVSILRHPHDLL